MSCWCSYLSGASVGYLHMVQLMPLHSKTPSSLASFKSRLVLPFCYWLTQAVLEKSLLNRCSSSCCRRYHYRYCPHSMHSMVYEMVEHPSFCLSIYRQQQWHPAGLLLSTPWLGHIDQQQMPAVSWTRLNTDLLLLLYYRQALSRQAK